MNGQKYTILTEASGSLTAAYLIARIQEAGHRCVASDIDERSAGRALADDFVLMPPARSDTLWPSVEEAVADKGVEIVIPSLDETLLEWSLRKSRFRDLGIYVVLSEPETVGLCQDKWLTHRFFERAGIPSPRTSLEQEYPLVKPRFGRGGVGVRVSEEEVDMTDMISQELVVGTEYTVDVFCDRDSRPVYIVPRRRLSVKDGKSTAGVTEDQAIIVQWVREICGKLPFIGPVNLQCFVLPDQTVQFIEINPRIAGGMALGMAATENWIDLIVENLVEGRPIVPNAVRFGLQMRRYYAEVFIPAD